MRAALFLIVLACPPAFARATSEVPYSVAEVFSTALRFVHIDKGCKIVDQDAGAAFVTFECSDDGKLKRGSVEIWKSSGGAHLQVTLGDDPHYMEMRWAELIERKLKEERGTPPPAVRPRPETPDAGT